MGFALGRVQMSYDDFCKCTPDEFTSICEAYNAQCETEYKDGWERARMIATILIQPHTKKRVKPHDVCPLPWDRETAKRKNLKPISKEEALARLTKRLKSEH